MSGAFESTLLRPTRSSNKLWMETGFGVNNGFERYRNSEYPVSDGSTSNRAQIYGPFDATNNPREYVAGAASLTIAAVVTVPTSNPSSSAYISWHGSSTTNSSTANHLYVFLSGGSSNLSIRQGGATFPTDTREFNFNNFRSTYSGQTIFLKITLTQGTATNPVIEVNGVNISSSFALTTGGTPPAWLDAAMVPTYRLVGCNWPSGPAPIVTPILGTTSAADDAFYLQTGKWPAWVMAGGSMSALNTSAWAVAFSGTSATLSANTASGFTMVAVSTGYCEVRANGQSSLWPSLGAQRAGAYVEIKGTATIRSGTVSAVMTTNGASVSNSVSLSSGAFTAVLLLNSNANYASALYGTFSCSSNADYDISGITIRVLGSLSLPSIQPINVVDDVSGIGTNCGLILGAATTATSNKKVWRIADLTKTSGNEQLLGGSVFVGTSQDYIKSWTIVNAGGTTTVSLGNVSGGAQYVSGLSVPTGTTVVTLLSNVPLTTNLWCNANTTASLTHIIEGYRTV